MKIEIKPYKGFNQIEFGLGRDQIRVLLDDEVDTFYRTENSKVATDSFDNLGIFANYDEDDHSEAFEFSNPSEPWFLKKRLLGIPYNELLNWFNELDSEIDEFDVGFTSFKYGIGFYASDKENEPHLPCEGIIIFKRSYYD